MATNTYVNDIMNKKSCSQLSFKQYLNHQMICNIDPIARNHTKTSVYTMFVETFWFIKILWHKLFTDSEMPMLQRNIIIFQISCDWID